VSAKDTFKLSSKIMNLSIFKTYKTCAAVTLLVMTTSLAMATLIESFETPPLVRNGSGSPPDNPPYTNVSQSASAGVTHGTYSMFAAFTNSDWSWMYKAVVPSPGVTNAQYGPTTYFEWYRHKKLKIDLHRPALTWGWNLEFVMAMNGPQGWQQNQLVPWLWHNAGEASSSTLTWDYSAIRDTVGPSGGYWQLAFMIRGNQPGGGAAYFDNLRFEDLVPAIGFTFPTNSSGGNLQDWVPQSWGTALAATYWDATDANTNAASGSMYAFCDFATATTNQTAVFQVWNFGLDTRDYATLVFDIKVDAATSTATSAGDFGNLQVVLRGNDIDWNPLGPFNIPAAATNAFVHYEVPLYQPLPASMKGINLIFGGTNLQGPINYYVDNILFLVGTNSPTLTLKTALPGLELNACAAADDQRQSIRTKSGTNGWIGRPGTVNYAMTINEGLSAQAANMTAHLFLIGTGNANPSAHADFNETNGVFLAIEQQLNGLCNASLRYKTNAPGSHGIRHTADGVLGTIANASMVGTWTLSLNVSGNAAQAALSAPGGASTNFTLPAGLVQEFTGSSVFAYFGVQPNQTSNIGQYVNFSRAQISGVVTPVDEVFTSQTALNTNVFVVNADNAAGIQMRPTNTIYRLSWNAPTPGFALYSATSLDAGPWTSSGLPVIAARQQNVVFLPATSLPSSGEGYFRLQNP